MKIIIVGPAYPYRGGIADTNESLARALSAKNHDVSIITFKLQYPRIVFPGKTQYSSDPKPVDLKIDRIISSVNPINWFRTARKINKQEPQLVIVRYWLAFLAPCLGTIARLLNKNIRLIAMCDNIVPHEHRIGDNALTNYFVKSFDGFITLSQTVADELKQFTIKPRVYFPHPINDNLGSKIPKAEARKYLNLDLNGKYLLFFGLIRKYKGLDLMLKAMSEKVLKELNVKLLVVGEFYDSPDFYYNLIKEYNIEESIVIKDEYIPTSEIKYYFSAADMVTQTYHSASQSGITQIAFNFDCPVLVTNVGGLSEIITHGKVGYVTSKDSKEIASCIVDLYTKQRIAEFEDNVKIEKQKYSWSAFANKLIMLYRDLGKV
jgi:D-inositol-3-phosphate glycosyltransferase